jgi:hypothetical protein
LNKKLLIVGSVAIVATFVLVSFAFSSAFQGTTTPVNPNTLISTPPQGAAGWGYTAYYWTSNGTLTSIVGCFQRQAGVPCYVAPPQPGQGMENVTGNPNIVAVEYHIGDYQMNLSTHKIEMTQACTQNSTCSSEATQDFPPS